MGENTSADWLARGLAIVSAMVGVAGILIAYLAFQDARDARRADLAISDADVVAIGELCSREQSDSPSFEPIGSRAAFQVYAQFTLTNSGPSTITLLQAELYPPLTSLLDFGMHHLYEGSLPRLGHARDTEGQEDLVLPVDIEAGASLILTSVSYLELNPRILVPPTPEPAPFDIPLLAPTPIRDFRPLGKQLIWQFRAGTLDKTHSAEYEYSFRPSIGSGARPCD